MLWRQLVQQHARQRQWPVILDVPRLLRRSGWVNPGAKNEDRLGRAWHTQRMPYAHKFLPANGEVVPFPSLPEPLAPGQRVRLAAAIIAVLLVAVLGVGLLAYQYFGLSTLDDYRSGYDVGLQWREGGANLQQCEVAMGALYGRQVWIDRQPGWGEFLVGCHDAASGEPAAPWYGVRQRLRGATGFD